MKRASGNWKKVLRVLARLLPVRRRFPGSLSLDEPRILALVPEGPDRIALQAISADTGWALTYSNPNTGSGFSMPSAAPSIVICDRELTPQHWREIVHAFAMKSPRPYVILLSSYADAKLWDDLQRAGGSEILRSPVDREDLLWVLLKAWQLWRTQQRVRPPVSVFTR